MNKKFLNSFAGSIVVFLVFLSAVNFLASQNRIYFDLTEEKIYTTSQATKNILKNLENDVTVNFYISKDLPSDLIVTKTQLSDLMNQYKDIAGSKLKVSYIEPENTPEKIQELAEIGIPQIQFNVIEKDKYEVKQGFFGTEIFSEKDGKTKRETIPIIQGIDNWEYEFISAVYSVSREKLETVAFLGGHGEKEVRIKDLNKSYKIANDVQIETAREKRGFYVSKSEINEKGEEETGKEYITPLTLVIAGPSEKISNEEISVIDEFISGGGNVLVFSESIAVDLQQNLNAAAVENNLNELTGKYGIEINSDLVYDKINSNMTYQQGFFSVSTPYPFWMKVVRDNFEKHPSLSGIQAVTFFWASSLKLSEIETYAAKPLLKSTNQGKTMSGEFSLLPDNLFSFLGGSEKIVAAVSSPKEENSKSGILFVVGDSDFITPNFSSQIPDNVTFFMNLVDSVSNSAGLASIRSKNIIDRPLEELEESEKNYWKFVSIFAGAILIDVYGVFRIMRRKKRNK